MKKLFFACQPFLRLGIALLLLFPIGSFAQTVSLVTDPMVGAPVSHALTKVMDVLKTKQVSVEKVGSVEQAHGKMVLVTGLAMGSGSAARLLKAGSRPAPRSAEALTVWKTTQAAKPVWVVSGADDRGLMYALLDVADRIQWAKNAQNPLSELKEITEKPAATERAVSIYTMNRAYWESRLYDEAHWARYLDGLAQNRFNTLVVIFGYENGGFLAPCYPYFFDVEGYPDVKMVGLQPQQQQKNLAAFNRLIQMAHDRGIRFTVGIWDHIYRGGVQGGGIPGTKDAPDKPVPGLVWGVTADNLTAYTKAALAKFIKQVPNLDAIQFRMHNESGLKEGEQESFWADVFRMMKTTAPNLRLDLRAKELPESVIQSAQDIGVNFRITTKFWMEQMGMPYHPTLVNPDKSPIRHSYAQLLRYPKTYRMHWRLWNGGTSRILLWGDPDYVRRFAESTHLYDGDGFEVNEPLATKMEAQPHDAQPFDLLSASYRYYDWEFERYWHFFQTFGRIGYNPATDPAVWNNEFNRRFGEKAGPVLAKALHQASWILPRIITSSYPYSSFPTTRGWAEKQRLGDLPSFAKAELSDMAQFASFDEEAKFRTEGGETARVLPSANSHWFRQTSETLNQLIAQAEKAAGSTRSKELVSTLTDLKILSNLSLYHSKRILAAVNYRIFERTQNKAALDESIAKEREAVNAWRQLVTAAGDVYTDNLAMGVCVADLCGHWRDELAALEKGLASLEQKRNTLQAEASTARTTAAGKPLPYKPPTDAALPDLFQVVHKPVAPVPVGKPIPVSITVSAPAGIKWVKLRYRNVNQELPYQTLAMQPSGSAKNNYTVSVLADQINPKWDFMYYIEIMDKQGRGKIYPDFNKETPYRIVQLIR
ncbi:MULTISPECIES: hypothetical protein [unclassified Spirosoma]|uniref:hypothetical protein n=1 Tax=unclassified Spirosoma TaxID=2621999 RepID=UPI0009608FFE|nr:MULTISPECIES: hypothetical protein [unclassified Spirosoma]MBN8824502.1 hypothetical protein [Spirosoma sp.]OJW70874.1 MAG: hypothetical protein BGO59_32100 [Spirosoma sp. 48-14]